MNHFLTVFYCSPILLKILQMMACCLSLRHPDVQLHGQSAPQKGLTYICEAFLHGKEHTTGQAFRHAPHFAPGRYALCFPFSSALNRSSLLSIPSLLLHGWAPAGFLRGFCRLAVSIGIVMEKGKAYQPGESLCQKPLCHPADIWSKGTGKR